MGMSANKSGHRIQIARTMQTPKMTQDDLAARMQIEGFNITKNMISRIELDERYVTDLELVTFAKVLNVSTIWLLEETTTPDR